MALVNEKLTARDRIFCAVLAYIATAPDEPCLVTREEYRSRRGSGSSSDEIRAAADEFLKAYYGADWVEQARAIVDRVDAEEQARQLAS